MGYTPSSTPPNHSTRPLGDTTNATHARTSWRSHSRVILDSAAHVWLPGRTPTVPLCSPRGGGRGWVIPETRILTKPTAFFFLVGDFFALSDGKPCVLIFLLQTFSNDTDTLNDLLDQAQSEIDIDDARHAERNASRNFALHQAGSRGPAGAGQQGLGESSISDRGNEQA